MYVFRFLFFFPSSFHEGGWRESVAVMAKVFPLRSYAVNFIKIQYPTALA